MPETVEYLSEDQAAKLMTSCELAKELNVSESWVRDHAHGRRRPVLPCINLGTKRKPTYRFDRQVIREWLNRLAKTS
jgi:hypothetical protein